MVGYHSVKFGGHRHSDSGDMVVSVCHVISQDHVTKESCDIICRSLSRKVTILPGMAVIDTL